MHPQGLQELPVPSVDLVLPPRKMSERVCPRNSRRREASSRARARGSPRCEHCAREYANALVYTVIATVEERNACSTHMHCKTGQNIRRRNTTRPGERQRAATQGSVEGRGTKTATATTLTTRTLKHRTARCSSRVRSCPMHAEGMPRLLLPSVRMAVPRPHTNTVRPPASSSIS